MPVLRMPQDNSLAETLGGLGQSLSNMWNPKTQMEAYLARQRLAMEQEQLALLRKKEEARQLALRHFSFLSRENQGVIEGMIYSDQPMDQVLMTGARLSNKGKMLDGAPADQRIAAWNEMYPGQPWKGPGAPIFGRKDQIEEDQRAATAKGMETSATETAKFRAQDQHMREIYGGDYPKPGDTSPDAQEKRARAWTFLNPNTPVPNNGIVPDGSPEVARLIAQRNAEAAFNTEAAKGAGTAAIAGNPLDKPAANAWRPGDPVPLAGGGSITTAAPPAATPTGPKAKYSDYADPNRPYAVTPAMESVVNGMRVTGPQPGAVEGAKAQTDKNLEILLQARDDGMQATNLLPKLRQVHDLASMLDSAGPGGQFDLAIQKKIKDTFGVSITNTSQIYQAIDQLLKQQIPDLRKQAGFQRLAGVDLPYLTATIGAADLPTPVLMNILANEQAMAELAVKRKDNALRTLGYDRTQEPLYMPDYQTSDTGLTSEITGRVQQLRDAYHAVGTTPAQQKTSMPTRPGATTFDVPVPAGDKYGTNQPAATGPGLIAKPAETPQPAPQAAEQPPPGSFYRPTVDPLTGKPGFMLITPTPAAPTPVSPAPGGGNP
jgi:hypothetical protein